MYYYFKGKVTLILKNSIVLETNSIGREFLVSNPNEFNLDEECIIDAKSVVFSAIQFAVFAGFCEIILYGVDFSEHNYGGVSNPNQYADVVIDNLLSFKKEITKKYPKVIFRFGATENEKLKKAFDTVDAQTI